MRTVGQSTIQVSVDRIDDCGCGIHEFDDEREPLNLGPLPERVVGEEIKAEIWAPNEARVVDPRYRLSSEEPDYSTNASVSARLKPGRVSLGEGDYMLGIYDGETSDGVGELVTGGYRIRVSDVARGDLAIVQIAESTRRKFGPNTAEGYRIDDESVFETSIEANLGLKSLKADGRWSGPNIGDFELDILSQIVQRSRNGQSTSVLSPGFNPYLAIQIAIELLYHGQSGSDVALYTPGSSVHWGTKTDIRAVYRSYGISAERGVASDAVPLDELFPHAYVSDGEVKTKSDGILDKRLVLSKKLEELLTIDGVSAIVVNWTSKKGIDDGEILDEVRKEFPGIPVVIVSSPYTKNEREGVPRYGPSSSPDDYAGIPTTQGIEGVTSAYSPHVGRARTGVIESPYLPDDNGDNPLPSSTTDLLGMLRDRPIEVESVDSSRMGELFDKAIEHSEDLREHRLEPAANKVYSVEMFFERLPVTPHEHNKWIQNRYAEGEYYLPEVTGGRLKDLEDYGGQIDDLQAPASIFGAVGVLERVQAELNEHSPMFDRLCEEVSNAVENRVRIGIFCPRKSWVEMLAEALLEEGFSDEIIGDTVLLVDPDTARDIPPCQRLLFTGPQRPQYAGYYLHPRSKETIVLSYDGRWSEIIQRHAERYVKRINTSISGREEHPIPLPSVEESFSSENRKGGGEIGETNDGPSIQYIPEEADDSGIPGQGGESYGVGELESISPEGDEDDDGDELIPDMDQRTRRRLLDIIDLSPTTNGELGDEWGIDSGSDVYQYLSSSLDDFYTRNENKLIVPTEEGRRIASMIRDGK